MNQDNQRLKEIQEEKLFFKSLLEKADTISDCLEYQERLDTLENELTKLEHEEKNILKNCGVII